MTFGFHSFSEFRISDKGLWVCTRIAVASVNARSGLCSSVSAGHPHGCGRSPRHTHKAHRKYKLNELMSPGFLLQRTVATILTGKCGKTCICLLHCQGQRRANEVIVPTPPTWDQGSKGVFWSLLPPDGQAHACLGGAGEWVVVQTENPC